MFLSFIYLLFLNVFGTFLGESWAQEGSKTAFWGSPGTISVPGPGRVQNGLLRVSWGHFWAWPRKGPGPGPHPTVCGPGRWFDLIYVNKVQLGH